MKKAKKGSRAWRAKLSKAQKAGWEKRRVAWRVEQEQKELEESIVDNAKQPEELLQQQIKDWYGSALTPKERQLRKIALHGLMYSNGSKSFRATAGVQQQNISKDDPRVTNSTKWHLGECAVEGASPPPASNTNPKTLTGNSKVPILSVVPPASIIAQATAMRYGAFFAPRVDGTRGYGPYNWRDQPIEAHIYTDAAMRHLMQWFDGEEGETIRDEEGREIDHVSHLAFALATIGILLDAKHSGTLIDDRPKARNCVASVMLNTHKLPRYEK
jgi:hypothetical protein